VRKTGREVTQKVVEARGCCRGSRVGCKEGGFSKMQATRLPLQLLLQRNHPGEAQITGRGEIS
jgi:hypothetical protein